MNSPSYLSVTCQGMVEGKTYRGKKSVVVTSQRSPEHANFGGRHKGELGKDVQV